MVSVRLPLGTAKAVARRLFSRFSRPRIRLAICASFRDEATYLNEWLRFHQSQGVDRFYLYDHESADNFREILSPWVRRGVVRLLKVGNRTQEEVNTHCARITKRRVDWLAFLDTNEFMFNPRGKPLSNCFEEFRGFSAVFVFSRLYGSSEKPHQGERGVLETFTSCLPSPNDQDEARAQLADWSEIRQSSRLTGCPIQGKIVVNPRRVRKMGINFPSDWDGKVVDERSRALSKESDVWDLYTSKRVATFATLRVNHYWSRGTFELSRKLAEPLTAPEFLGKFSRKPTLIQVKSWDSMLSSDTDLDILKTWRRHSAPYVFLIGFNKTATRAFSHFFSANGFPSVHWDKNRLVKTMLENLDSGRKIFHGYDQSFRFFSDLIYFTSDQRVEGNAFFRRMDSDYPGSLFILNNRATKDWLVSRQKHDQGLFLEGNLAQLGTDDVGRVLEMWREEKSAHEKAVREYFHGRDDFIEIDIDSPDIPNQIAQFLKMDFTQSAWKRLGRTVDRGLQEKSRK